MHLGIRGFNVHQSEVDILSTLGLMAMNSDQILPGLECRLAGGRQWKESISSDKPAGFKREHTVDVNFGIFIVMDPRLQGVVILGRQIYFAAQPDVIRLPGGADDGARGADGAKTAVALLPG